jgi:hypothetical protein
MLGAVEAELRGKFTYRAFAVIFTGASRVAAPFLRAA